MDLSCSTAGLPPLNKRRNLVSHTTIQSLNDDNICTVFSFLDFVHLIRCTAVCKSWFIRSYLPLVIAEPLINQSYSKLYTASKDRFLVVILTYQILHKGTWKSQPQDLAISQHRSCLQAGSVDIYQWKGHSDGIDKCKMKMGLLLTGGKVMRLWSVERQKCLAEYYLPHTGSLIDFNFDESKVVGLVGSHICLWRRNERKSIFSSHGGQIPQGSSMCYVDP